MTKIASQTPSLPTQFAQPSLSEPTLEKTQQTTATAAVQGNQFEQSGGPSLQSMTGGGDAPVSQGAGAIAGQSLLSLLLQGMPETSSSSALFELKPSAMRHSVGLNQILQAIPNTPEGKGAIQNVLGMLQAQTGITLPQEQVEAILEDPTRLTDVLKLDPAAMSQGFKALNAHHAMNSQETGAVPTEANVSRSVNLDDMDSIAWERPEVAPKQIAPGLWQGSLPSDLPDAQAKTNSIVANTLDQLARNADAPEGEKFQATYKGEQFDNIDGFLQALKNDGHEVEVVAVQRVANFADLKTKGPEGQWMDVPAPLFVDTGIEGADGETANVPAIHSELVLRIRNHDNPEGINADVKWYQGIERTGFYPVGLTAQPEWAGWDERPVATGDKAIETMRLAGLFADVVSDTAAEQGLARGGYGMTGVCNDSVALIEHAITGSTQAYPLLMQDERLLPELQERLQGSNAADAQRLMDSVRALPSDSTPNETQQERALKSIPWGEGNAPFVSTEHARNILSN
jgi:hypothetical protein